MDFEKLGLMLSVAANVLRLILELGERIREPKEKRARHARRTR